MPKSELRILLKLSDQIDSYSPKMPKDKLTSPLTAGCLWFPGGSSRDGGWRPVWHEARRLVHLAVLMKLLSPASVTRITTFAPSHVTLQFRLNMPF